MTNKHCPIRLSLVPFVIILIAYLSLYVIPNAFIMLIIWIESDSILSLLNFHVCCLHGHGLLVCFLKIYFLSHFFYDTHFFPLILTTSSQLFCKILVTAYLKCNIHAAFLVSTVSQLIMLSFLILYHFFYTAC